MFLTSVLALTDFSLDGDKALVRAGQIAIGYGAILQLMYVSSGQQPKYTDPRVRAWRKQPARWRYASA